MRSFEEIRADLDTYDNDPKNYEDLEQYWIGREPLSTELADWYNK